MPRLGAPQRALKCLRSSDVASGASSSAHRTESGRGDRDPTRRPSTADRTSGPRPPPDPIGRRTRGAVPSRDRRRHPSGISVPSGCSSCGWLRASGPRWRVSPDGRTAVSGSWRQRAGACVGESETPESGAIPRGSPRERHGREGAVEWARLVAMITRPYGEGMSMDAGRGNGAHDGGGCWALSGGRKISAVVEVSRAVLARSCPRRGVVGAQPPPSS